MPLIVLTRLYLYRQNPSILGLNAEVKLANCALVIKNGSIACAINSCNVFDFCSGIFPYKVCFSNSACSCYDQCLSVFLPIPLFKLMPRFTLEHVIITSLNRCLSICYTKHRTYLSILHTVSIAEPAAKFQPMKCRGSTRENVRLLPMFYRYFNR